MSPRLTYPRPWGVLRAYVLRVYSPWIVSVSDHVSASGNQLMSFAAPGWIPPWKCHSSIFCHAWSPHPVFYVRVFLNGLRVTWVLYYILNPPDTTTHVPGLPTILLLVLRVRFLSWDVTHPTEYVPNYPILLLLYPSFNLQLEVR
jgi:hypothetical protein